MRTRVVVSALGVTALAMTAVAAADLSAKERGNAPLRFTAVGKLDRAHVVDNEPSGLSPGDVLVFSQKLYNRSQERVIGSSRATCTRTTARRVDYLCSGAFLLRGRGQITIQGVDPPQSVTRHPLVVTGGSGRYRGVRGEITVHHVSPTKDRFRFILRR